MGSLGGAVRTKTTFLPDTPETSGKRYETPVLKKLGLMR